MNLYKKFLRNLILITAVFSILTVAFCLVTDPYEIWNIYSRQGFNLYAFKGENTERLTKPLSFILHHKNTQTIIIGTSRPDLALNPETWKNLTGNETYNFGVTSATIYEQRRYIEHIFSNGENIEEVILCVDFFNFIDNPQHQQLKCNPGFDDEQIGKSFPTLTNLQKTIFSWDAVKDGFLTVQNNFNEQTNYPCHELNGKFSEEYLNKSYNRKDVFLDILYIWKKNINFADAYIYEESFKYFQQMVELCREKNIKLYVFIFPLYPLHYECFNPCWEVYEEWKVKLTSIHDVYDFTCFDENITQRKNFWDTSHIKSNVGDMILKSIHSGELTFGEILTPENVQQHNHKIRQQRETWQKNHAEEIEETLLVE